MVKFTCFLLLLLAVSAFSLSTPDELKIDLSPKQPHTFVFTNKKAAFWYGETQRANQNSFQGYTILEQRYVQDYTLLLDGKPVSRSSARQITLFPDRLERRFEQFTEIFHFVDSLNVLLIDVIPKQKLRLGAVFHFVKQLENTEWKWNSEQSAYETEFTGFGLDKPSSLACAVLGNPGKIQPRQYDPGEQIENFRGGVGMEVETADTVRFTAIFARNEPERKRIYRLLENPGQLTALRRERVNRILHNSQLSTGNDELDAAYRWALISLNDLVTEQRGTGIWAGLPWFNNYWGRDSFISFPGALLCTGQFRTAREVLLTFSKFQNTDPASRYYGRIPNRVMLNEIIYNTTDGTPWFVKACDDYLKYSGDTLFMEQMFPALQRAMEGALKSRVDSHGFLTHGDAETWMDAVGTEGPWSPRGNRAVEVQALWAEQIRISQKWAHKLGFGKLAKEWRSIERKVRNNFPKYFWNEKENLLSDHLNSDDSQDFQLRPNQIFAVTVPRTPLLPEEKRRRVISTVVEKLTYPWGVGSLWQEDPNFHPYHHYLPYYVPDAAYHNGIVWTWLNGPLLSALFPRNRKLAMQLLSNEADQILHRDAVGSFSELLEAWPRENEKFPRISGTVSQAWSLAEFIRNINQDLLGIKPNAAGDTLFLHPNLPAELKDVNFTFRFGSSFVQGNYLQSKGGLTLRLNAGKTSRRTVVVVAGILSGEEYRSFTTKWKIPAKLEVEVKTDGTVRVNGQTVGAGKKKANLLPDLKFCRPEINMDLAVLKGLKYDLISPEEAVQRPGRLTRLVFDASDSEGDDRGPNHKYIYPTNPAFLPGIFDGKRVKIWKDERFFYFEIKYQNLTDPGWHPEPGYQLTFTAIAMNFGAKAGMRRTRVSMNANHNIPFEYSYNYILFIGNGYRLMNSEDKIIAEYRPPDRAYRIGFVKKKTIRFSVPVKYFPAAKLENAYVMIGGQDDHGAGGVGEFRTVKRRASEWNGGGGDRQSGNSSVYDEIEVR